jgi:hypothetical protein
MNTFFTWEGGFYPVTTQMYDISNHSHSHFFVSFDAVARFRPASPIARNTMMRPIYRDPTRQIAAKPDYDAQLFIQLKLPLKSNF